MASPQHPYCAPAAMMVHPIPDAHGTLPLATTRQASSSAKAGNLDHDTEETFSNEPNRSFSPSGDKPTPANGLPFLPPYPATENMPDADQSARGDETQAGSAMTDQYDAHRLHGDHDEGAAAAYQELMNAKKQALRQYFENGTAANPKPSQSSEVRDLGTQVSTRDHHMSADRKELSKREKQSPSQHGQSIGTFNPFNQNAMQPAGSGRPIQIGNHRSVPKGGNKRSDQGRQQSIGEDGAPNMGNAMPEQEFAVQTFAAGQEGSDETYPGQLIDLEDTMKRTQATLTRETYPLQHQEEYDFDAEPLQMLMESGGQRDYAAPIPGKVGARSQRHEGPGKVAVHGKSTVKQGHGFKRQNSSHGQPSNPIVIGDDQGERVHGERDYRSEQLTHGTGVTNHGGNQQQRNRRNRLALTQGDAYDYAASDEDGEDEYEEGDEGDRTAVSDGTPEEEVDRKKRQYDVDKGRLSNLKARVRGNIKAIFTGRMGNLKGDYKPRLSKEGDLPVNIDSMDESLARAWRYWDHAQDWLRPFKEELMEISSFPRLHEPENKARIAQIIDEVRAYFTEESEEFPAPKSGRPMKGKQMSYHNSTPISRQVQVDDSGAVAAVAQMNLKSVRKRPQALSKGGNAASTSQKDNNAVRPQFPSALHMSNRNADDATHRQATTDQRKQKRRDSVIPAMKIEDGSSSESSESDNKNHFTPRRPAVMSSGTGRTIGTSTGRTIGTSLKRAQDEEDDAEEQILELKAREAAARSDAAMMQLQLFRLRKKRRVGEEARMRGS